VAGYSQVVTDGVPVSGGELSANPLITVAELTVLLEHGPPPCLLDIRWRAGQTGGYAAFQAGHLPGAVFVDLDRELAAPPDPTAGRHPLPEPAALQAALRRCGVCRGSVVVAYDDWGGQAAARAWWLLRWAGVTGVRVLDGGLAAWARAGGRLEQAGPESEPTPDPGDVTVVPGQLPVLDTDGAAALARSGILLDARSGERYRGEVEPLDPVAGHVPGAVSAPTEDNLDADGRFLDGPALRERFSRLGVDGTRPVGVYCGSGVTAAHEVLALAVVGVEAALYAGSWSAWIGDPARPVAVGALPG
jgi:thiosulfate/3-mercaptopyruvate sulfurtransferase